MSREQIEEMAKAIDEFWKSTTGANFEESFLELCATSLYAKGFCKHSEGKWNPAGFSLIGEKVYKCSECDFLVANMDDIFFGFCPHCGSKMKGGAE